MITQIIKIFNIISTTILISSFLFFISKQIRIVQRKVKNERIKNKSTKQKKSSPYGADLCCLVRITGLETAHYSAWNLNPARLPFRHIRTYRRTLRSAKRYRYILI